MSYLERAYDKIEFTTLQMRPLCFGPQARGMVLRTRIVTPRKPNSARRPAAKIKMMNKSMRFIVAHIPGKGHNIRRHSAVLVRGGGARDLPGVYYTCIRGVLDFAGAFRKTKRRSIYGVQRNVKKLRRKYRKT